ncbi:hypothetical protein IMSHALPRED_004894 [Imshaugia aleurites]|uniref:Uncharacterized protein n=1 Tax=Imshaugia aleurites TaxID=172621 RepID=A0A8H3F9G0_9LECA|nr:hypothetical protein IMSHALPRED_004894 [Imshaugia aleurites]
MDIPYFMKDWHSVLSMVILARGPNLHGLCFDSSYTPYEESPTSLAMYYSRAFAVWLRGLIDLKVNLEDFIDQELKLNPKVHAGWEKETLLDLFAHGDRPDLEAPRGMYTCSDCVGIIRPVGVQPYWRYLPKMIKERKYPDDLGLTDSEVGKRENADFGTIEEIASSPSDLTPEPDTTGKDPLADIDEFPSESKSEEDTSGDPAIIPVRSGCPYSKHEVVCMDCWLHYERTGTRRSRRTQKSVSQDLDTDEDLSENEYSPSRDDSSEDEFSPFLIHS